MSRPLSILAALTAIAFLIGAPSARAAIPASGDTSQPSGTPTNHSITGPSGGTGTGVKSVSIVEDVIHSPAAGPWHKNLINNTTGGSPNGQLFSGVPVDITETLTNLGGVAWNQWTEQVVTRTTIANPNDAPGFQFENSSLMVEASYGGPFAPLINGVHYAVAGTPAPGPGFEPNGWESFTITLFPGFEIGPGDVLRINKDIFEVFGDGNVWVSGEAAEIAQFPGVVPEPAGLTLLAAAGALLRRRKR
jgi:hypothetical protein